MAGEFVVVEVNGAQKDAARERKGDGGVEVVGVETEFAELKKIGKRIRSELTGELETR